VFVWCLCVCAANSGHRQSQPEFRGTPKVGAYDLHTWGECEQAHTHANALEKSQIRGDQARQPYALLACMHTDISHMHV